MIDEEKLKKVCDLFSKLNEQQQDYILGILQAMLFVLGTEKKSESDNPNNPENKE